MELQPAFVFHLAHFHSLGHIATLVAATDKIVESAGSQVTIAQGIFTDVVFSHCLLFVVERLAGLHHRDAKLFTKLRPKRGAFFRPFLHLNLLNDAYQFKAFVLNNFKFHNHYFLFSECKGSDCQSYYQIIGTEGLKM